MKFPYYNHRFPIPPIITLIMTLFAFSIAGCKKIIEVNAPVNSINAGNVYSRDATATAVLTGLYARISNANYDLIDDHITAISLYPALSADELTLYNLNHTRLTPYYRNDLTNENDIFWGSVYYNIYITNAAIEGLNNSTSLTPAIKQQLIGEAKFIRAFCYFYLTNLFGDVPLAVSTDWKANALLARAPGNKVYQQIITDLKDAQNLLSIDYLAANALNTTTERVRPLKWAATALLARTYLYTGDYVNAEAAATAVINNSSLYGLGTLDDVFLKNSREAIWQLQPVRAGTEDNTGEGALFILPDSGPNTVDYPVYLSMNVVNSFEAGDQRRNNWVGSVTVGPDTYYFPFKYKIGRENTSTEEYIMVLRLAEQYLIRAEARAQQNNIPGAKDDLDVIRSRAGLAPTTANDKTSLLTAILHERQAELFTEWGHRWFDLKRTGNIDTVMNVVATEKGSTWSPYKAFYPIPQTELDKNPNLAQNTGY